MNRIATFLFVLFLIINPFQNVGAFDLKKNYPRLANYYLQPNILESDYDDLARNDLLIIDIDADNINPSLLAYLKKQNPELIILMYVPSQSVNIQNLDDWAEHRIESNNKTIAGDWWLHDSKGKKISFNSSWPNILWVDPGHGWSEYLSDAVRRELNDNPLWDGVFYDMVFANLSWLNAGDIDIDQDGIIDETSKVNAYWQKHMQRLMVLTRQKIGEKLIVNNTDIVANYEDDTNGVMFENFPADWLGPNSWAILLDEYVNKLPEKNSEPNVYVINSNANNRDRPDDYREMRYGLTSTLMGDGYYSFDFGDTAHNQTWWYDEYNVNLGQAQTPAYNLLDKGSDDVELGLWRRDFENGIAIVNSSEEEQSYVFFQEEFDKINGIQDPAVNTGEKVNWIQVPAKDGLILLKRDKDIVDSSFNNGSFARVFDSLGRKKMNGFFTYKDAYPGNSQVLISDIDSDGVNETLVNTRGVIKIYDNGKETLDFMPYDGTFKGEVSFAVSDLNGDGTKEIITGAGQGGGPHVRVFDQQGRPLTAGFFAYDKAFRGGVDVAVIDLNADGSKEIVTSAGPGGGPHVRVFSKDGEPLIGGFFAYEKTFKGGVSVAVGDVDRDGEREILTSPGKGSSVMIKIFNKDGKLEREFLAYEEGVTRGARLMSDDLDNNGYSEILVSLID